MDNIIKVFGKEGATELLLRATETLAKKSISPGAELSPKAKELFDLFVSFGTNGINHAIIWSTFLGEDIRIDKFISPYAFEKFAVVVPTSNSDGHNYQLYIPCVLVKGENVNFSKALKFDGTIGSNISMSRNVIRLATEAEIRSFIKMIFPEDEEDDA